MAGGSALLSGATAAIFGGVGKFSGVSDKIPFFRDSNYIMNNFIKFATDYGGITLKSSVIIQAAGQIAIRETVAGFVGAPLNTILEYFDQTYRLRKLGMSMKESFGYAFFGL